MLGRIVRPVGGPAVFDPATLNLSGWWRANYTGAPWAARASAGTSLANGDLTTNGSDPTTGAAQNGLTPAEFNGSANNLRNTTDITSFATTTASTIIALFLADGPAASPTGNIYDDNALLVDGNGDYGLTFTSSGITGFAYDGGYQSKSVACSTGSYHLVMMRHDGANLGMTLDSAAEVTQACGTLAVLTGFIGVGRGYAGGRYFDGRILELMTSQVTLTPTNYANVKSYVNSRYALAL